MVQSDSCSIMRLNENIKNFSEVKWGEVSEVWPKWTSIPFSQIS